MAARYGQSFTESNAAWAIAKKDIAIYYFKPNIVVSGALFPLFMFLAFAIGNNAGPSYMIPGLIAITILFSASSIEPVSIPIERRMKTFDRLISAPISLHAVVLGESLSGFLYSTAIAFVPFIAAADLQTPILNVIPLVAGCPHRVLLCHDGDAVCRIPDRKSRRYHVHAEHGQAPADLHIRCFIPISAIPTIGQDAVYFSPLTYGNDPIQAAYHGHTIFNPLIDVVMLCVFILVFQFLANRLYKKFNE